MPLNLSTHFLASALTQTQFTDTHTDVRPRSRGQQTVKTREGVRPPDMPTLSQIHVFFTLTLLQLLVTTETNPPTGRQFIPRKQV